MTRWTIPLFLIATLALTAFFPTATLDKKRKYLKTVPPGTVKIADNLFYDQTEIRNLDYAEYIHWTEWVFGKNSEEYKSVLPDNFVWRQPYPCLKTFEDYYLLHPHYRHHPVVGITQKQADNFSKWRSDRVFEYILISNKIIDWNFRANRDTNFTIEKYFNGQYMNYKPDTNFIYYPVYRLPTIKEYNMALHFADSVDSESSKIIQCEISPCTKDSLVNEPTVSTYHPAKTPYGKKPKTKFIFNLRGNVSEWTAEPNICVSGGWTDSKQTILSKDTFNIKYANYSTGFRCVCEWVRWTKK